METDRALQSLHTRYPGEIGTQIGHGGEARVYEMTAGRVLRVHHSPPAHPLSVLSALYDEMRTPALPFALPQIIEHGEVDGCEYSIDARIPGKPLIEVLLELRGDERRRALDAYLAAATMIASIEMRRPYFGEIIRDGAIQTTAWREFLHARVERSVALMHDDLRVDVPSFETALAETHRALGALPEPAHALVHGDYFPGNVLVGNDLTVTGVIDFGPLTVIGDPMMAVASAVIFLETTRRAFDPEDAAYLTQRLVDAHGEGAHEMLRAYRGFYAIRLSNSKPHDEHLYGWCLRSLAALAGR
jgi:aminoglycoside phosphotransferase (APT) family kinase protein